MRPAPTTAQALTGGGAARPTQPRMLRAVTYARISSDPSGKRAGVRRQGEDTAARVAREGWDLVGTYVDDDTSAFSGKPRPQFDRMVADAAAGHFDVVVVWALDRLCRRIGDLA